MNSEDKLTTTWVIVGLCVNIKFTKVGPQTDKKIRFKHSGFYFWEESEDIER